MKKAFTHGVLALLLLAPVAARAGILDKEQADVAAGNRALAEGSAEEALRRYEAAAKDHGEAPELAHDRGVAYLDADRAEEALAAFGEAIARRGETKGAAADLAGLGTALAKLGRDAEARAALQKALELDPDQATARKNLEALLRKQAREEQERQQGGESPEQDESGEQQQAGNESGQSGQEQEQQARDQSGQSGQEQEQQAQNEPGQSGQQPEPESGSPGDAAPEDRQAEHDPGKQDESSQAQGAGDPNAPEQQASASPGGQGEERDGQATASGAIEDAVPAGPIDRTEAEQLLDALQAGERPFQLYRRQRARGGRTDHDKDW